MKLILIAGATALALTAAQPAHAQAPIFNWSGFYLGGHIGGAWAGDATATDMFSQGSGLFPAGTPYAGSGQNYSYSLGSSFLGGLTVGANWQAPQSALVWGLEAEIGWLNLRGSRPDPSQILSNSDVVSSTKLGNWYGAITGRIGFAMDRTLFYAKGGVTFVNSSGTTIDACTVAPCSTGTLNITGSQVQTGLALGGGLEWAFNNRWSVKAEYLWFNLPGDIRVCGPGGATAAGPVWCGTHFLPDIHAVKFGMNFRM